MTENQQTFSIEKKDPVYDMLTKYQQAIKSVLPSHLKPERMLRVAHTMIYRVPKLKECTPVSLINAVIDISMKGLEIGSTAHIIPFKREATVIYDYKGLIELAHRSGQINSFPFKAVYQNDFFDVMEGTDRWIKHQPAKSDRGSLIAAYAVANFKHGGFDFEVVYPVDIEAIKKRAPGANYSDSPWNQLDLEWTMWCKTAVRRLAKRIPQSPELQSAVQLEDRVEAGLSQDIGHIATDAIDVDYKEMPQERKFTGHQPAHNGPPPGKNLAGQPETQNGMYGHDLTPEDRDQGTTIESPPQETEKTEGEAAAEKMNRILVDKGKQPIDPVMLKRFLLANSENYKYPIDEVVSMAAQSIDKFLKAYENWYVPPPQGTENKTLKKGGSGSATDIRKTDGYKKYDPAKEELQVRYSKAKVVKLRDMFGFYNIEVDPKFLETATGAELHLHLLAKLKERNAGQDEPPADDPPAGEPGEVPFDLSETQEWNRLYELSKSNPEEYRSVMEGRSLNTLSDLQQALNLIETKLAEDGFVGDGDGMPEG